MQLSNPSFFKCCLADWLGTSSASLRSLRL
jgi:hypothetical protein